MKHRIGALCAAIALALTLTGGGRAAAISQSTAQQAIQALGIMVGDAQGSMNLGAAVTRAEFVTMMTAASPYKGTVGSGYGVSLFKDVKSDHWAGQYVRLAIEQGWMVGYVDGTFRPDKTITLEEGCAALLRLLGYDPSALAGSFPTAQLSKAASIGLLDNVSAVQGQTLTRQDCVGLFYNLMLAKSSAGTVYGTSLGYTIQNGELDYTSLISAETKGPYIAAASGALSLPFDAAGLTVYRDGALSAVSAVNPYDVYYYNENLRTVWVYSQRVTGTLTDLSPSTAAPTSATVAGVSYKIGTSSATYKLSSQGEFSKGDVVTLLLGMDGDVADVISAGESQTVYYGMVLSSAKGASSSSTAAASSASVQVATQIACADGITRTFYHSGGAMTVGRLVSASLSQAGTTVKNLSDKALSGRVSADGAAFAGYAFADNVQILDTDEGGGYLRIYPSRLAGANLSSGHVRYYSLNSSGEIDLLILDEVTGDTRTYAYLTKAEKNESATSISASYQYMLQGSSHTLNGSTAYGVDSGGIVLVYQSGSLKSMRQLSSVAITDLSTLYATAGEDKYPLAEDVQVLLFDSSGSRGYYATTLSAINTEDYAIKGWYDSLGCPAGGRIRILVATQK